MSVEKKKATTKKKVGKKRISVAKRRVSKDFDITATGNGTRKSYS